MNCAFVDMSALTVIMLFSLDSPENSSQNKNNTRALPTQHGCYGEYNNSFLKSCYLTRRLRSVTTFNPLGSYARDFTVLPTLSTLDNVTVTDTFNTRGYSFVGSLKNSCKCTVVFTVFFSLGKRQHLFSANRILTALQLALSHSFDSQEYLDRWIRIWRARADSSLSLIHALTQGQAIYSNNSTGIFSVDFILTLLFISIAV